MSGFGFGLALFLPQSNELLRRSDCIRTTTFDSSQVFCAFVVSVWPVNTNISLSIFFLYLTVNMVAMSSRLMLLSSAQHLHCMPTKFPCLSLATRSIPVSGSWYQSCQSFISVNSSL